MIREIVKLGHPVLRRPTRMLTRTEILSAETRTLIADMHETLEDAGGVGLAAPQVALSLRVILAGSFASPHAPDRPVEPVRAFINPVIVSSSPDMVAGWEGCLSIPDLLVRVERPRTIAMVYIDETGQPAQLTASGFFARVLQHELDHLDGILITDRAQFPKDIMTPEELRAMTASSQAAEAPVAPVVAQESEDVKGNDREITASTSADS